MGEITMMALQKLGDFVLSLMKQEVMVPVWIFVVLWMFTWVRK